MWRWRQYENAARSCISYNLLYNAWPKIQWIRNNHF
jgi:hypothetical protein